MVATSAEEIGGKGNYTKSNRKRTEQEICRQHNKVTSHPLQSTIPTSSPFHLVDTGAVRHMVHLLQLVEAAEEYPYLWGNKTSYFE